MSDDKRQDQIDRGIHAQALINDVLLIETFGTLEAQYIKAWRETPARDSDARERLYLAVNVVGKVREHLVKLLNDGKMAQREIDELARPQAKPLSVA